MGREPDYGQRITDNGLRTTDYEQRITNNGTHLIMVKRITLFDGFTVTHGDKPIPKLISRKADILLAYLAQEQRPFTREQLATLLWPDRSQKQALSNLRTLLSSLRKHASDFVTITRQTVAIKADVWVDTAVFQQQLTLAQNNWPDADAIARAEDALALYHGEFLDGILVDGSFKLESWMQTSRDHLRHLVNNLRQELINHYLQQGEYAFGIKHAHALLQDDPLDEAAHRQMMILLTRSGQRSAAIEQYETCRRILDEELEVEPDDETTALLRRIELAGNNLAANLPVPLTTFVGRARERRQINKCLRDGQTRLLTLIGLGGIGKTRLVIQIAHDMADHYLNGVYFVPLAPLESAEFLVSAIAAAVHLDFAGQSDPKKQLFSHLREKEALLVLDNFEHLLAGARLLDELLQNAPNITLLVTSRERLQLRAEHLFEIGGLSCPSRADTASPTANPPTANYDSLHLFRDRARLVDINFGLTAENYDCVTQICRLLQGMPLGIELAAAWIRVFSCSQILAQIEQNIDFLATQMRDVPERHRSLRAVFDYVWELLSSDERLLFVKLSLFRGGFTIEAATAVADVSPWTIAALVEKSLLRKQENGRYEMLEALGRFAVKIEDMEGPLAEARARHARYYADFLAAQEPLLNGRRTREALKVIAAELENVHTAWTYAITYTDFDIAGRSLSALALYYNHKGLFVEGARLVETAVHRFEAVAQPENPTHCDLLSRLYAAWSELNTFISHYDQAIAAAKQAIRWGKLGQSIKNQATGFRLQGWYCYRKGDYNSATEYTHKGMEMAQTVLAEQEVAAAARAMSAVLVRQGSYRQAAEYAQHAATLFHKTGNYWGNAKALNMLGISYWYLGDYDRSKQHYQQSMSLYQELSNSEGETIALGNLGLIAVRQRNYEEASHLYQRALHNFRHAGDRWGESWALNSLGNLAAECVNFGEALRYCRDAVRVAAEIGGHLVESDSLRNLGYIHWRLGAYARADAYFRQSTMTLSERSDAHDEGNIFHDRSWLAHDLGDNDTALAYARQALAIGEANENMPMQAAALTAMGNAFAAMDDWAAAEAAYRRALPLWDNLQQPQRAVDAQAGLIRIALAQGDLATAVTLANEILAHFANHSIDSVLSPFGAYLACVQALQAADDPRADEVLAEAKRALAETAVSIQNASLRHSYLRNVPAHRTLQAM